jgi:phage gpG-like protein
VTKVAWTQREYENLLPKIRKRGLTAVGILLSATALDLAPEDTARLKGSITWATNGRKQPVTSPAKSGDAVSMPNNDDTLHVGTNVEYAIFQEYGTWKMGGEGAETLSLRMASQSYMRKAMDREHKRAVKLFASELAKGLQEGR